MDLSQNQTNHKDLDRKDSSIQKCQKTNPAQPDLNKFRCMSSIATKDLIHKYFPKSINTSINDSLYNQTCTGFLLFMHRLWLEQTMCDMIIHADGGSIMTHQIVIATYSPALSYIFSQNSIQKMANVTLCDVPVEVLADVLNCLYTTDLKLNENNIEGVVLCAKQLDLPVFLELCKDFLTNYSTTKNIIFYYCLAINYKFTETKHSLLKTIAKTFCDYKNQTHLYLLPYERFLTILKHPSLKASSADLLESVVQWINFDQDERIYYLKNLFNLINLEKIEASSLSKILDDHNWILDDNHCRDMVLKAYKYHAMCEPRTTKKIHIDKTSSESIERNTTANNQTSKDSNNEESLTKTSLSVSTVNKNDSVTKNSNEYCPESNTSDSQAIKELPSPSKSSDEKEDNTNENKSVNSKDRVHFSTEEVKYIYPDFEDEESKDPNEEHSTQSFIESRKVLNTNLAILKEKFDIATKFSKETDDNGRSKYFSLKNNMISKERKNNQMRFKILPGDTRKEAGWRKRRDMNEDDLSFTNFKTESNLFKTDRRLYKSKLEKNLSKLKERLEVSQYCKVAKEMQKYNTTVDFKILPNCKGEDKMAIYKTHNLNDLSYAQARMKTFSCGNLVEKGIYAKDKKNISEDYSSRVLKPQESNNNSSIDDNLTCAKYNNEKTKCNKESPYRMLLQSNLNGLQKSSLCLNENKIPLGKINTVDGSIEQGKITKNYEKSENQKHISNDNHATSFYGVFNQPLCNKSIKQNLQSPSPTSNSDRAGFRHSNVTERFQTANTIEKENSLVHPSDLCIENEALLEMKGHVYSNIAHMPQKQPETIVNPRYSLPNRLFYEKMIDLLKNDLLLKKSSNLEPITLRNMYGSLEKVIDEEDFARLKLREISFEDNKVESYDKLKNTDRNSTSFFSSTDGTPGSSIISIIKGTKEI